MVLVAIVASGAQSSADPQTTAALLNPAPATGVVLDDTAQSYAAQHEAARLHRVAPAITGQASVIPAADLGLPPGPLGIPGIALQAYRHAADQLATTEPGCHLPWTLLAGIGRIESGHADGGLVDTHGTTLHPILGPLLDGTNPGDGVVLTTNPTSPTFDRAVGPMQFLPSTWALYGADGNGDGVADPNNIFDAALGTGRYLCSGGLDLTDPTQARAAVYRYDHSDAYATNVLDWSTGYATNTVPTNPTITDPTLTGLTSSTPAPTPAARPASTTAPAPTTTTQAPAKYTPTPARTPATSTPPHPATTTTPTAP
jgi:membrane-bound lytic murein transglycosylase B